MKFKAAISIEDGPLPYVVHVAVPHEGGFIAAQFRFKKLDGAQVLQTEYLTAFIEDRKTIYGFHKRKIRELHGEPYTRED